MPCFREGRCWVVTHGFIKKTDKIDPEQIRRAERIRELDAQRPMGIHKVPPAGTTKLK